MKIRLWQKSEKLGSPLQSRQRVICTLSSSSYGKSSNNTLIGW